MTIRGTSTDPIDRRLRIIVGWVGGIARIGGRNGGVVVVGSSRDGFLPRDGLGGGKGWSGRMMMVLVRVSDDDGVIGGIIERAVDLDLVIPRARRRMIVHPRVFELVHDHLDVSHGEFWSRRGLEG